MDSHYVYIMASRENGTLYVGMTHDLKKRVWEHKNDCTSGFTREYRVHKLVYFEGPMTHESALLHEKRLKKWRCRWKMELIEKENLFWEDLYDTI